MCQAADEGGGVHTQLGGAADVDRCWDCRGESLYVSGSREAEGMHVSKERTRTDLHFHAVTLAVM